ncbi:MAG: sporulation protein YabP [Lachnospiraceae bacterium]|nr:sporulation protein YabP [Lachnospiraceae bacterium]
MDERQLIKAHKISLNNRLSGAMTGVREVLSFDAGEIVLDTEQGIMIVKGEDLHVTRLTLDKGEVEINGRVDGILYTENEDKKREKGSFLTRLLR